MNCAHNRDGICWLCAYEGEGPSWWKDVKGYGSNRDKRHFFSRLRQLLAALSEDDMEKMPTEAQVRAKAYTELFSDEGGRRPRRWHG